MSADMDDIARAVALLDPVPQDTPRMVDGPRARADLDAIVAGERDVDAAFGGSSRRSRALRAAVPIAASVVGVGLLARALVGGDFREPQLAAPVELAGAAASDAVEMCRDREIELVGTSDFDVPGVEAMWAAEVALVEERGDIRLVVMRPREAGETYLAYCVFERGEITVGGVGGYADDEIPFWTADRSSPPAGGERLVWGELPDGAVAVEVDIVGAEPVEGTLYPTSGLYTLTLPDDVLPFGDVVITLEDGTTERFQLG